MSPTDPPSRTDYTPRRRVRRRRAERRAVVARRRNRRLRFALVAVLVPVLALVAVIASVASIAIGRWDSVQPKLNLSKIKAAGSNTEIFDRNGNRLGFVTSTENHQEISFKEMPLTVKRATLAIEDQKFYEHDGVDWQRIAGAAVKNFEAGRTEQGGSTITQQLVGNTFLNRQDRSIDRKIKEAKLALALEARFTTGKCDKRCAKNKILAKYLNSTFYGHNAVGIEAASRTYFNKPAAKLTMNEAALLAGLPQSPTFYDPIVYPEAAKARRDLVLQSLVQYGTLTQAGADKLKARPLGVGKTNDFYFKKRQPLFYNYIKNKLTQEYGGNLANKGLSVKTTIDPALQRLGAESIDAIIGSAGYPHPDAALVTLDPHTGEILAMVSSANATKDTSYNLALGKRQPGSTAKVWGLTAAIDQDHIDPDSTYYVSKSPLKIDDPKYGPPFEVKTYDESSRGRISLTQATLSSDNSVYMQLGLDVGPDVVADEAHKMGIVSSLTPADSNGAVPSIILGSQEVTPLEQASAFGTLDNGGVHVEPTGILSIDDADGQVATPAKAPDTKAFSDGVAYEVTKLLEQNVQGGTGTAARLSRWPAAGKTGTAENFENAWFVGYTGQLVTAVWVGFADANIPMLTQNAGGPVNGGSLPTEIWGRYMEQAMALKGYEPQSFPLPKEPVTFETFRSKFTQQQDTSSTSSVGGSATPAATSASPTTTAGDPNAPPGDTTTDGGQIQAPAPAAAPTAAPTATVQKPSGTPVPAPTKPPAPPALPAPPAPGTGTTP